MVLYHGSSNASNKLNISLTTLPQQNNGAQPMGEGIYLTQDAKTASDYGEYIYVLEVTGEIIDLTTYMGCSLYAGRICQSVEASGAKAEALPQNAGALLADSLLDGRVNALRADAFLVDIVLREKSVTLEEAAAAITAIERHVSVKRNKAIFRFRSPIYGVAFFTRNTSALSVTMILKKSATDEDNYDVFEVTQDIQQTKGEELHQPDAKKERDHNRDSSNSLSISPGVLHRRFE
jgi:hypothetical protein